MNFQTEDFRIELTFSEISIANHLGAQRRLFSEALRRKNNNAPAELETALSGFDKETLGVCGELVVAKLLGVYPGLTANGDRYRGFCDVMGLEVRTTARPDGCLIVRPHETDSGRTAVLVTCTGQFGVFKVPGWIDMIDAPKFAQLEDRGAYGAPAYFVAQSKLRLTGWLRSWPIRKVAPTQQNLPLTAAK